jgi:hypothetical protein
MADVSPAEREAMEAAVQLLPGAESEGVAYGESVWLAAREFFDAAAPSGEEVDRAARAY